MQNNHSQRTANRPDTSALFNYTIFLIVVAFSRVTNYSLFLFVSSIHYVSGGELRQFAVVVFLWHFFIDFLFTPANLYSAVVLFYFRYACTLKTVSLELSDFQNAALKLLELLPYCISIVSTFVASQELLRCRVAIWFAFSKMTFLNCMLCKTCTFVMIHIFILRIYLYIKKKLAEQCLPNYLL